MPDILTSEDSGVNSGADKCGEVLSRLAVFLIERTPAEMRSG